MKTLKLDKEGRFKMPKKYVGVYPLHIRSPWSVEIWGKPDKTGMGSVRGYFRYKKFGQKPYVPEGFVEINKERYKVIEYA